MTNQSKQPKLTNEQQNEQYRARVVNAATAAIERALLNVIAASWQTAHWIDYEDILIRAKANVAQEAADTHKEVQHG